MKNPLIMSAAGAALLFSTSAFAADVAAEISTAQTHAGLAAKAANIDGVHMHMHHALNCLVGPGGTGFDAKEMNPCANAGNGAIPDSSDPGKKQSLQAAVTKAESGIAATDLAAARKIAADTAAMLKAH